MSRFTAAFEGLLNAQEMACGSRPQATIGSVTADAIIGESHYDPILAAGGITENGVVTVQMRVSDFETPPVKLQAATANGQTLSLLDFTESHGVYLMVIGDPVARE